MSIEYTLKFSTEDEAKTVLKPFGLVIDSPIFGEHWAINVLGHHTMSMMISNAEYLVKLVVFTLIDGLDSAVTPYIQNKLGEL